ncbi:MAG TPA: hypothetical protein VGG27_02215 [Magnetospirillaceae bacterium]|jgi:hypothetical protein
MATRLMPKTHISTILSVHECVRVRDFPTCSIWRAPTGFCFTVPREGAQEQTDEISLAMIMKLIAQYGTPGGNPTTD